MSWVCIFSHLAYLLSSNLLQLVDIRTVTASNVHLPREELMLILGQERELGDICHLQRFIASSRARPCPKLSHWKWYHHKYKTLAGPLYARGIISKVEYHGNFWVGIPTTMKRHLHETLQALNPHDCQLYPIQEVHAAAILYFEDIALLRSRLQNWMVLAGTRSSSPMSITTSTVDEEHL